MRRGLLRRLRGTESGAGGGPALLSASLRSVHWRRCEQVPRAARVGPADRRRRRHGRACSRAPCPGCAAPRRRTSRAPESVDRRAPRLHPRRRRADRDEHVRREPAEARAALPRGRVRADQRAPAVKLAREAREVSGRDVFIAGSIGPLGDAELQRRASRRRSTPSRREILEGRGVDLFMVETFYDLDDLETAVAAMRSVSALPIVALMTFDSDRQTLAGVSARRGRGAAARARRRRVRREPRRRAGGRARRARRDARRGAPLAALPNVGLASMSGQRIVFPHATPAYFGEFAAQARALGARDHRRLLRHDAGADRRDPRRDRRERSRPSGSLLAARARARVAAGAAATSRRSSQRLLDDGEFVVSVQLDPPLGANPEALLATARAVRESGKAQFVDVNDNPRARARMSGIMASRRDRALHRRRDDPAPDAARHDGRRPRVAAARRARRGRAQHPRGHGRSAGGRRLPGHARRLRGRLDRARRADGDA